MSYTAIIIDDEEMGAELLQILLEKNCPEIDIVSICSKPELGIEMIKRLKPKIVFLDVEMPKISGFNLLEQVKNENFECIFTTAYDHYAIHAIKHNALDYLLKPIDVTELKSAVLKAKNKIDNGNTNLLQMVTKLVENMPLTGQNTKFSIPVGGEVFYVESEEVLYFEADSNYTNIYLDNKDGKITSSKNLKKIEEGLNIDFFFRIHNSYIINLKNVI